MANFTSKQIQKARACRSVEEFHSFAKENGFVLTEAEAKNNFAQLHPECCELADDELQTIVGGCGGTSSGSDYKCPKCQSTNTVFLEVNDGMRVQEKRKCNNCGHEDLESNFEEV